MAAAQHRPLHAKLLLFGINLALPMSPSAFRFPRILLKKAIES
ncbi:hypothetical protein [Rhodoblastus sp.]